MRFQIATDYPIAADSNDHLYPRGTANDNHANKRFNEKLIRLIGGGTVSVLDLGCAGGGMVKMFLDAGHIAVGIEGSDYSQKAQRAAWAFYPGNLFTADATKPFSVSVNGSPHQFDAVTAWEFFEHIKEPDLPGVIDNILRHLKVGGWLIASIADTQVTFNEVNKAKVIYHHTVKPANWWIDLFASNGMRHDKATDDYFGDDRVRRSGKIRITAKRVKQ